MKILASLGCLIRREHDWVASVSMPGHQTCRRCRLRRKRGGDPQKIDLSK
jgi:hypothetical protein